MAGYVIHLAVAREYIRNFKVKDEEEFIKGTLAPDLLSTDTKQLTHYSDTTSSEVNLKKFIDSNTLHTSYIQGYFLHLIVDYLFYNKYFTVRSKEIYNDYDILNEEIIKLYNLDIPEEIKDVVQFKTGELQVLDKEKVYKLINEISRKSLKEYKKEIKRMGTVTTEREETKPEALVENKRQKIKLGVLITILCAIMLFFMIQKEGFHCDEIFSYGSSNCAEESVFYSYKGDDIVWRTREEANNYMKALNNRFNYKAVYENQKNDVHPPLFYMIVHTVCSILNNTFSKYIIFFISLPFFIGTCILIWKILNLIDRKPISILTVALYGLSLGGISTMMFQRMYMMLTFFTIAYLYLNISILKNKFVLTKKHILGLFVVSVLGFLTQYFFAIYAALVSLFMIILFIVNKKFKEMFKYIGTLVLAAITGLLIFPSSIDHLLHSDRRIGSFEAENYGDRVSTYFNMILRYFGSKWEIVLALFAIALLAIVIRRKTERGLMSVLIGPTIMYILVIAKIAEFLELRYVMNILPIIAVLIMMAVGSIYENKIYNNMIAFAAVILLSWYGFTTEKPQYLYKGYDNYIEISKEYSEDNLVYVGYTFFNHIQSLPEFMNYNKTLMIYNDQLEATINNEELQNANEFILSVNSSMDPEGVRQKIMENTGFEQYELLYNGCEGVDQVIFRIYR